MDKIKQEIINGVKYLDIMKKYNLTYHEFTKIKKTMNTYYDGGKEYKICSCCGDHKENIFKNFYRSKTSINGLEGQCKKCRYIKKRNYKILNLEKVREQYKKYNKNIDKKYYIKRRDTEEKREAERVRYRKRYKKNKEKVLKKQSEYYYSTLKPRALGIKKI